MSYYYKLFNLVSKKLIWAISDWRYTLNIFFNPLVKQYQIGTIFINNLFAGGISEILPT